MRLKDEGRHIPRGDGSLMRRPRLDDGWGPERAARYARRRRSYVAASRLQLDARGGAEVRLDFPRAAAGKGAARAEAARRIARAYGVQACGVHREELALAARGDAEDVARFVDGLPRVLDHAEQLASWVARMYGSCARRPRNSHHFDALGESGRRAAARAYRATAFRVIVDVLLGPEGIVMSELDDELPLWEQAETHATVIGQYGWLEICEAYDPAEAWQLLDQARPFVALIERWPVADPRGDQLALFEETPAAGPVVVIPCSGAKLDHAAEAGQLYTGKLHRQARKAADAATAAGGTVLVLSALHGFLPLSQVIEPYDHQWGQPGSITEDELRAQAVEFGLAAAEDVVLLTPGKYTARAAAVWPHARTPLAHLGIGRQLGRLAALRARPEQYTTAA
ncbi:DUF6884 domain-containing protein [Streptomyces sp. NBC_01304]|uniref:DUF6884 domain-containing protein n=1 Tax=Streptomyces sp. NBC_01304 TaxID=2903818 RepID=UPI002E11324D|nr:DUF6884 domain-containing protein [Streptomyces sp. NBC_01304]WSJ91851.1 hypothetical protein OG430_49340 [Streptomyces sp. NBC_01304]